MFLKHIRKEFLQDHGRKEKDVLCDEDGEYIWAEPLLMDEGENESSESVKIYLPVDKEDDLRVEAQRLVSQRD